MDYDGGTAAVRVGAQRHEGDKLCTFAWRTKTAVTPSIVGSALMHSLALSCTQELLDDVRRHRSDSVVNHRLVTVLRASGEVQARWQELRVGDVVKVRVAAAARTVIESGFVMACGSFEIALLRQPCVVPRRCIRMQMCQQTFCTWRGLTRRRTPPLSKLLRWMARPT